MTHNTRFTGSVTGLPTPREVRIERDLLDIQERVASRPALVALDLEDRVERLEHATPPAMVRLDVLERHAAALEAHTAELAALRARRVEPLAYAAVWVTADGETVIDKAPTTLDIARAELADYRASWPDMTHRLVALVPVEETP